MKTSTLNCPDYMATHEEDYCTLSILEGTNMELKFYLDTDLQSTFTIAGKSSFTITGKSTFTITGKSTFTIAGKSTFTITGKSTFTITGKSTFTITGKSTITITGKSRFTKADNSSLLSILPYFTMRFCLSNSLVLTF